MKDDEELMKVWNTLDADTQEEFRSRLFDELSRRGFFNALTVENSPVTEPLKTGVSSFGGEVFE